MNRSEPRCKKRQEDRGDTRTEPDAHWSDDDEQRFATEQVAAPPREQRRLPAAGSAREEQIRRFVIRIEPGVKPGKILIASAERDRASDRAEIGVEEVLNPGGVVGAEVLELLEAID